jgi:glycerol-3-phosphate acyltransferase PlsY
MVLALTLVAAAYLVGSLSTAVIISKSLGLPDPRSSGSGNPGATNVLRLGGKKAAIGTLLGDLLKGLLPVLLARVLGLGEITVALVGLAAFLGHLFPVFFGFQGGKGVATALGIIIALSPATAGAAALTWFLVAALSRYSSLAALMTALLAPVYLAVLTGAKAQVLVLIFMAALLFWRHKDNIRRLLNGTESRIGANKTS